MSKNKLIKKDKVAHKLGSIIIRADINVNSADKNCIYLIDEIFNYMDKLREEQWV